MNKNKKLTDKCKTLKKKKLCIYYENKNSNFSEYNDLEDIEDLFKIAKKKNFVLIIIILKNLNHMQILHFYHIIIF